MNWKILLVIFMSILFALLYGERVASHPQQQEKNKQELQHEVTVSLKLVQIYVTDKKGNPITDLEKSDFKLYEDGKLKAITEFEKHILSLPITTKKPREEPNIEISSIKKMTRKFFLFFDFAFNNEKGIIKSRDAALHFLDTRVQPDDEVGLLSYSRNNGLVLHEFLTTDHIKIQEAVENFSVKKITGRARDVEYFYWLREAGGNPLLPSDQMKLEIIGTGIERKIYRQQVMDFSFKINDLAKALRYIPGNKNIVLFSSGVASSLLYGKNTPFGYRRDVGSFGDIVLRSYYEDMIKELASANCKVYALNTEELRSIGRKEEEILGVRSLQRLSNITGGKYYEHVHDFEEIMEEIQAFTGSYYILGYYVDEKWDGKYHKIDVKVNRKRCRVYTQKGYFNPKPFTKFTDIEKQIHLIDLALSDKPQFQIPTKLPQVAFPFSLDEANAIMLSKISLDQIQNVIKQDLELITLVFDRNDNVIDFRKIEFDFSSVSQDEICIYSLLNLSPGEYKCRLIIRNLMTGDGAVASSALVIPELQGSGFRISQPLFLISDGDPFYLKCLSKKEQGEKAKSFSIKDYISDLYPELSPLVEEIGQETSSIFALIQCSVGGIEEPEVNFYAHLIHIPSKLKILQQVSVISEKSEDENTDLLLLELVLPELEPGEYFLILTAEELSTNEKSAVRSNIIVK